MSETLGTSAMRFAVLCFLASLVLPPVSRAQVPVFKITTEDSSVKFAVKASVAINGTFDKWDATLTFTYPDLTTGVRHQDSVRQRQYRKRHEGRQAERQRLLQRRLGSVITFLSKKIVQTGPTTFDGLGDFTIRGALNLRR